jgi:hypothetical protein
MIKTLRITSVLAVIGAAVLIKYFVLPMVFNATGDERVEKILDSPTVVEQFKETKGAHTKPTGGDTPLLVQKALAFARYLSPQPEPKPRVPGSPGRSPGPSLGPTSPKFKVFATTYFEGNPELSQALIDEPGKGRHWVRQSSMVGHLLIEQVKDGVVVVKSSNDTYELEVETNPKAAPAKGTSPVSKAAAAQSTVNRTSPSYSGPVPSAQRAPSKPPVQPRSPVPSEKADELIERLRDLQRSRSADDKARINDLISKFQSNRANAAGAQNPTESGENVKSGTREPNQASSKVKGSKIDAGPTEPDSTAKK